MASQLAGLRVSILAAGLLTVLCASGANAQGILAPCDLGTVDYSAYTPCYAFNSSAPFCCPSPSTGCCSTPVSQPTCCSTQTGSVVSTTTPAPTTPAPTTPAPTTPAPGSTTPAPTTPAPTTPAPTTPKPTTLPPSTPAPTFTPAPTTPGSTTPAILSPCDLGTVNYAAYTPCYTFNSSTPFCCPSPSTGCCGTPVGQPTCCSTRDGSVIVSETPGPTTAPVATTPAPTTPAPTTPAPGSTTPTPTTPAPTTPAPTTLAPTTPAPTTAAPGPAPQVCNPASALPNQCFNSGGNAFICCAGGCPSQPGTTPACAGA